MLTYREMMERFARLQGRRIKRRIVRVGVLTPELSSDWVALVTPVEYDQPLGFDEAVRAAMA